MGDNPDRIGTEAGFAALCGTNPIPASSGKTIRYRLNKSGDRQANWALYMIAKTRLGKDPETRAYKARRIAQGKKTSEIIRCLKRAIAREMFHLIVHPRPPVDVTGLRPARKAQGLTQHDVADRLGVHVVTISRMELGKSFEPRLVDRYKTLLSGQAKPVPATA